MCIRDRDEGTVTSIYGSTTLVIGLGDIGNAFASSMKKLGSYLLAVKRLQTEKPDYVDELYTSESLEELLPRADIVAVCVPGNDSTYHMLDSNRLNMMKPGAILVNVGRGSTVDTDALAQVDVYKRQGSRRFPPSAAENRSDSPAPGGWDPRSDLL